MFAPGFGCVFCLSLLMVLDVASASLLVLGSLQDMDNRQTDRQTDRTDPLFVWTEDCEQWIKSVTFLRPGAHGVYVFNREA